MKLGETTQGTNRQVDDRWQSEAETITQVATSQTPEQINATQELDGARESVGKPRQQLITKEEAT